MGSHKFNRAKLDKLNAPERLGLLDLDQVLERFHLTETSTVADLGAGTGLYAEALLDRCAGATCHALDIEPAFLDWMREHRRHAHQGRLLPTLMDEAIIPLSDESVDFLFMISLHHELDAPEELLVECRRVLVPGGGILVADWDPARLVEGQGPPKDHLLAPEVAQKQLVEAGFVDVAFFDASPRYYCLSAAAPA